MKIKTIQKSLLTIGLILIIFLIWKNLGNIFFTLWYYNTALSFFPNNKVWIYNKWNSYYKLKEYDKAKQAYLKIVNTGNNLLNYYLLHNLGNTFYRLWQKTTDLQKRYQNWLKAVKFYQQALTIWKNIHVSEKDLYETEKNLEFVLNKLKQLNQKQNKQQKQNSNQNNSNNQGTKQNKDQNSWNKQQNQKNYNSKNNSESNKKSWNSTNTQRNSNNQKNKQQNSNSSQKWNSNQWTKNKPNNYQSTNKSTKQNKAQSTPKGSIQNQNNQQQAIDKALEQYEQRLLQQQKYNIRNYYNKKYQPKQNPFDDILNDPFFDSDPFFEDLPFNNQNQTKDR